MYVVKKTLATQRAQILQKQYVPWITSEQLYVYQIKKEEESFTVEVKCI